MTNNELQEKINMQVEELKKAINYHNSRVDISCTLAQDIKKKLTQILIRSKIK